MKLYIQSKKNKHTVALALAQIVPVVALAALIVSLPFGLRNENAIRAVAAISYTHTHKQRDPQNGCNIIGVATKLYRYICSKVGADDQKHTKHSSRSLDSLWRLLCATQLTQT